MATITISDLRPAGSDLLLDPESFLNDLTDGELNSTHGGSSPWCVIGIIALVVIATQD